MAFAPVAAAAGRGAAARGAASRAGAARSGAGGRGTRKITAAMTPDEVSEELNARRVNAKHAARDRRDAAAEASDPEEVAAAASDPVTKAATGAKSGPTFRLQAPDAVGSGSGVVLGVLAWVVAMNYLRGGVPQVKKLLRAKFLNQTD